MNRKMSYQFVSFYLDKSRSKQTEVESRNYMNVKTLIFWQP